MPFSSRQRDRPGGGRRPPTRVWLALAATVICAGWPGARLDASERPTVTCEAQVVGDRVLATVSLRGFVEDETLRLLRLGMRGRVRVEATALRRRWGVFEQAAASRMIEARLSSTPDKQDLLLDDRTRLAASRPITLERLALRLTERDATSGRLSLRVAVQLQVGTMSSLSKVAAWATEPGDPDASSSLLTRGLLAAVVNDLTRSAECTCDVAPSRAAAEQH
jgi:hypothetical protein